MTGAFYDQTRIPVMPPMSVGRKAAYQIADGPLILPPL